MADNMIALRQFQATLAREGLFTEEDFVAQALVHPLIKSLHAEAIKAAAAAFEDAKCAGIGITLVSYSVSRDVTLKRVTPKQFFKRNRAKKKRV